MPVNDPQTLTALAALGCIENNRVDGTAVAQLLATQMEANHVAVDLADVTAKQVFPGELANLLIGHDDPEFVDLVKALLSADAGGRVQKALSNGNLLCSGRAQVVTTVAGEIRHISLGTRFLSSDPDVLEHYVLDARAKRVETMAKSTRAIGELVAGRQPTMTGAVDAFYQKVDDTWKRELGTGTPDADEDGEA